MKQNNLFRFILAFAFCLLCGCAVAFGFFAYDRLIDSPAPIADGQTVDFSAYGFTLTVPDDFAMNDYTANNLAEGDSALFAGCLYGQECELYLFVYANEAGDSITDYELSTLYSYYMSAGGLDVRTRDFGGKRFICYGAAIAQDDGILRWDTYETWDSARHVRFETKNGTSVILPILETLRFMEDEPTSSASR